MPDAHFPTPSELAAAARSAIARYTDEGGSFSDADTQESLTDLLVGLRHLTDELSTSWTQTLRDAERVYRAQCEVH